MSQKGKFGSDLRVGIVTFLGILCLVAGITFAGGDKGLMLQETLTLHAHLHDVNSLKKGATVTMGGMSIGKVTGVGFLNNSPESLIDVTMEVRSDVLHRIKTDSKPCVRTQGMLGDRYIEITTGSKDAAVLENGRALEGTATSNFDDALQEARSTLTQTTKMLEAINQKQGTAGQFIYDQQLYQKLLELTAQISEVLADFKQNPKKYIKLEVF